MTSKKIHKKIQELEYIKAKLEDIENKNTTDINELIYIKYIELESVSNVAKFINELGYKNNNRKYISNDISNLLNKKDVIADLWIDETAKKIFKENKKKISKRYY